MLVVAAGQAAHEGFEQLSVPLVRYGGPGGHRVLMLSHVSS